MENAKKECKLLSNCICRQTIKFTHRNQIESFQQLNFHGHKDRNQHKRKAATSHASLVVNQYTIRSLTSTYSIILSLHLQID